MSKLRFSKLLTLNAMKDNKLGAFEFCSKP